MSEQILSTTQVPSFKLLFVSEVFPEINNSATFPHLDLSGETYLIILEIESEESLGDPDIIPQPKLISAFGIPTEESFYGDNDLFDCKKDLIYSQEFFGVPSFQMEIEPGASILSQEAIGQHMIVNHGVKPREIVRIQKRNYKFIVYRYRR
jgi:hypothetical protein